MYARLHCVLATLAPAARAPHYVTAPIRRRACHASASTGDDVESDAYHVPVLRDETVSRLICADSGGTYLDATLGGAGHSAAILDVIAPHGGHLIAADRDPEAIAEGGARLARHVAAGSATLLRASFAELPTLVPRELARLGRPPTLDGILLDLGVSSHQVAHATAHAAAPSTEHRADARARPPPL